MEAEDRCNQEAAASIRLAELQERRHQKRSLALQEEARLSSQLGCSPCGITVQLLSFLTKLCHFAPPPKGERRRGKMAELRFKKTVFGFLVLQVLTAKRRAQERMSEEEAAAKVIEEDAWNPKNCAIC